MLFQRVYLISNFDYFAHAGSFDSGIQSIHSKDDDVEIILFMPLPQRAVP